MRHAEKCRLGRDYINMVQQQPAVAAGDIIEIVDPNTMLPVRVDRVSYVAELKGRFLSLTGEHA